MLREPAKFCKDLLLVRAPKKITLLRILLQDTGKKKDGRARNISQLLKSGSTNHESLLNSSGLFRFCYSGREITCTLSSLMVLGNKLPMYP